MARRPDTQCSGPCGALIWSGSTSLPSGQAMCRSCRRKRAADAYPKGKHPCMECGTPAAGDRCRPCYYQSTRSTMTRPRNGSTRAWRKLRAQVLTEEPLCRIQIEGICTTISTQADHIIPIALRPDLDMVRGNLQGACGPCNRYKGSSGIPAESSRDAEALRFFGD